MGTVNSADMISPQEYVVTDFEGVCPSLYTPYHAVQANNNNNVYSFK